MKNLKFGDRKERLLYLRQVLVETQETFSEEIACSSSYISKLERGDREVTSSFVKKVIKRYKFINAQWLLCDGNEMYSEKVIKSIDAYSHIKIGIVNKSFTDEKGEEKSSSEVLIVDASFMESLRDANKLNQLKLDCTNQDDAFEYEKLLDRIRVSFYNEALINSERGIKDDINYYIYKEGELRIYPFDDDDENKNKVSDVLKDAEIFIEKTALAKESNKTKDDDVPSCNELMQASKGVYKKLDEIRDFFNDMQNRQNKLNK